MIEPMRLEQHWLAFACSAGGGGRLVRVAGAQVLGGARSDAGFCNFILLREADPSRLAATLELGEAILAGEGRASLLFVGPSAGAGSGPLATETAPGSASIEEALVGLGWRQVGRQVVLAAPLPPPALTPNPAVTIRPVLRAELDAWGELLTEAYEVSPLAAPGISAGYTALFEQPGESAQARFYLGELSGRPVGTGLAWQRGELLGLYAGAVLPAARGNGVERASLWQRMQDGAAAGARWAYLQTEVGSPVEGLARRHLAFQPIYERDIWARPVEIQANLVDNL